jgi:hypothetical protein
VIADTLILHPPTMSLDVAEVVSSALFPAISHARMTARAQTKRGADACPAVLISQRTKAVLAANKASWHLRTLREKAKAAYDDLSPMIAELKSERPVIAANRRSPLHQRPHHPPRQCVALEAVSNLTRLAACHTVPERSLLGCVRGLRYNVRNNM